VKAWQRRTLVTLTFAVATIVMLRLTVHNVTDRIEGNSGDPAFTLWTMKWVSHKMFAPTHVFGAPIFWPRPLTLAWSDPLFGFAPAFGLFRLLTGNDLAAWNLVEITFIGLNLGATYALVRRIVGRTGPAVVAALANGFSGFVLVHLAHLQMQAIGFFPLTFWLLFIALERRRWYWAVAAGASAAMLAVTALYFSPVIAGQMALIVIGYAAAQRWRPGPGFIRTAAIAAVTMGVLIAPTALQYLRAQNLAGQTKPALIPDTGFRPVDLLAPKPDGLVSKAFDGLGASDYKWERTFFVGVSTLILAAVGLIVLWRKRDTVKRRVECVLVIAAGLAAMVLALGDEVAGLPGPLRVIGDVAPGLDSIRAPARLAAPLLLAVTMCAAVGLAWLGDHLRAKPSIALQVAAGALVFVELATPVRRVPMPLDPRTRAVYEELAHRPGGPTVELPMADLRTDGTKWAFVEAPRMVLATIDWNSRVNGYSGGSAPEYLEHIARLNALPAPEGYAELRLLRVRYLILHTGAFNGYAMYTTEEAQHIVDSLPAGAHADRINDDWLIDLHASLGSSPVATP
jgi:hypothetical protein